MPSFIRSRGRDPLNSERTVFNGAVICLLDFSEGGQAICIGGALRCLEFGSTIPTRSHHVCICFRCGINDRLAAVRRILTQNGKAERNWGTDVNSCWTEKTGEIITMLGHEVLESADIETVEIDDCLRLSLLPTS